MTDRNDISLSINGRERAATAGPWTTLLDVVREQLDLTGAKRGCNQGVCGACTVLIDGRPMRACLSLAANCVGLDVTTVEGLGDGNDLVPAQTAIMSGNAVQCGFCTPGMVVSAHALLAKNPKPTPDEIRDALSGNLCRCSGYQKIVEALADIGIDEPGAVS